MRRMVYLRCLNPGCETVVERVCDEDDHPPCPTCSTPMEQDWWTPSSHRPATVWCKAETAVVHRRIDGQGSKDVPLYRFPMKAEAPVPRGYERVEVRSDVQMARVEREAGVRSEVRWYDRGSGRGHESDLPPVPRLSR
jgi:hypothetical protein